MQTTPRMRDVGASLVVALQPFTPPARKTPRIGGHVLLANGITLRANAVTGQIENPLMIGQENSLGKDRRT